MDVRTNSVYKERHLLALYRHYVKRDRAELKDTLTGFFILIGCFCLFDVLKAKNSQDALDTFIVNFVVWSALIILLLIFAALAIPNRYTYLKMSGTFEYWRTPDIKGYQRTIRGEWVFLFNGILVHPLLRSYMLRKINNGDLSPDTVYSFYVLWFEPPWLRVGSRHMERGLIFSDFEPCEIYVEEPLLIELPPQSPIIGE